MPYARPKTPVSRSREPLTVRIADETRTAVRDALTREGLTGAEATAWANAAAPLYVARYRHHLGPDANPYYAGLAGLMLDQLDGMLPPAGCFEPLDDDAAREAAQSVDELWGGLWHHAHAKGRTRLV